MQHKSGFQDSFSNLIYSSSYHKNLIIMLMFSIIPGPASVRGNGWSDGRGGETDGTKGEGCMGVAHWEGEGEERERRERDGSPEESGWLTEAIQETGTILDKNVFGARAQCVAFYFNQTSEDCLVVTFYGLGIKLC